MAVAIPWAHLTAAHLTAADPTAVDLAAVDLAAADPTAEAGPAPAAARTQAVSLARVDQFAGAVRAVAARGDLVFVGVGPRLVVYDLADSTRLRELGRSEPLPGIVTSVALAEDIAYVTAGAAGGLRALDVADPTRPREVGALDTPGAAEDVAVSGGLAFVADGADGGLRVIDISDPTAPTEVAGLGVPGAPQRVAFDGRRVLLAAGSVGGGCAGGPFTAGELVVVDVVDPARPRVVGTWTARPAAAVTAVVAMAGDLAVVAIRDPSLGARSADSLAVLDLTRPAAPEVRAFIDDAGDARDLVADGTRVYGGASVVDLGDPADPELLGAGPQGLALATTGGRVLAADDAGLDVWETTPSGDFERTGGQDGPSCVIGVAGHDAGAMAADPHRLWMLGDDGAGRIGVTGQYGIGSQGSVARVAIEGDRAYAVIAAGSEANGVELVDLSDPRAPGRVGAWWGGDGLADIAFAEDLAYVIENRDGARLHALSVHDPTRLREVARVRGVGRAARMAVFGDHALLVSDTDGLVTLDLSDRRRPVVVHRSALLALAVAVRGAGASDGPRAVVVGDALHVLDLTDPATPREIGALELPPSCTDVALWRDAAVVACGPAGVLLVDLTEPESPRAVGPQDTPGNAVAVTVRGDDLWIADASGGVIRSALAAADAPVPTAVPPSPTATRVSGTDGGGAVAAAAAAADSAYAPGPGVPGAAPAAHPSGPAVPDTAPAANAPGPTVQEAAPVEDPPTSAIPAAAPAAPARPLIMVVDQTGGAVRAAAWAPDGRSAYVAMGPRVVLVDLSDPVRPRTLARGPVLPGIVGDLAVTAQHVLAVVRADGERDSGLWVLDAQGLAPIGRLPAADAAAVAVRSRQALLGAGRTLMIVDLTFPSMPSVAGTIEAPNIIRDVVVAGDTAFLAIDEVCTECWGVFAYDLADPDRPRRLGSAPATAGVPERLAWQDGLLYVADGDGGLAIIDASVPERMRLLGRLAQPEADNSGTPGGPADAPAGTTLDVAVDGRHAFLVGRFLPVDGDVDGGDAVRVVDISDPSTPLEVAFAPTPGEAMSIALAAGRALVAAGTGGAQVLDVTQAARPVEVGAIDTIGDAVDVTLDGGMAFVSDRGWGLRAYDVSASIRETTGAPHRESDGATDRESDGATDRESDGAAERDLDRGPVERARFAARRGATAFALGSTYGFLAAGTGRLWALVDPRDPLVLRGAASGAGYATRDIASEGRWTYGVSTGGEVTAWDAAEPREPDWAGRQYLAPDADAQGVAVSGDLVVVAQDERGLGIYAGVDPSKRREIGRLLDGGNRWVGAVTVVGDRAYAGGYGVIDDGGFSLECDMAFVVDLAVPAAPRLLGETCTFDPAEWVAVSGSRMWIGGHESDRVGATLLEVDAAGKPEFVTYFHAPGDTAPSRRWTGADRGQARSGGAANGDTLVLAAGEAGLLVLRVGDRRMVAEVHLPTVLRRAR